MPVGSESNAQANRDAKEVVGWWVCVCGWNVCNFSPTSQAHRDASSGNGVVFRQELSISLLRPALFNVAVALGLGRAGSH